MNENVIKLSNPLLVNGQSLKELTYTLELDVEDILIANDRRAAAHNNVDTTMKVVEFDSELHLYVGMQAIIKLNPQIDIRDLKRLSGVDVIQLFKLGRTFFTRTKSGENLKTSNEQSVITQEDTTAQN